MIYLDNAATTWPKPESVYKAVDNCLRNIGGNPGRGGYKSVRTTDRLLFEVREELAALIGANSSANIMFGYNATDAINTSLFGTLKPGDTVLTTSMEHNSVTRPLRILEKRGVSLKVITCDKAGRLPIGEFKAALDQGVNAVVIQHASNVTGAIQPLKEIGQLTASQGALLIVDAAQTAGAQDINVQDMHIDILTFSGHKSLLGIQGIGGLFVREGLIVDPLRYGGTGSQSESDEQPEFYPDRLESGTMNTPGLAGLLAGLQFIRSEGLQMIRNKENKLTRELISGLSKIAPVKIYGPASNEDRVAVVSFTMDGRDSAEIAYRLDQDYGIACRAGLHCAPWAHRTIGTLKTGTIRFSPGYFNSISDISMALAAVEEVAYGGGKNERYLG